MQAQAPVANTHRPKRDAVVLGVGQGARLVLFLLSMLTLSRLLGPADFGLMAMITAVLGVGEIFRDAGLSLASIQAAQVTDGQRANLFWLNVAAGGALTLIGVIGAPAIAAFYGHPEVSGLMQLASLTFLLNGAAAQYRASLIRAGRFRALVTTDVTAQAIALATAVLLAVNSMGAGALVAQQLTVTGVALLAVCFLVREAPGLPSRRASVRPFFSFGLNLLGTALLTYASRNLDNVLIGRFYGPAVLGPYSKAYQLYSQPQQQALAPFTNLAVRTLSAPERRHRYARDVEMLQRASNYIALVLLALLAAAADPVIQVMLGPGWSATVPLLRILCIGGAFQLMGNIYYWIFLSEGLTRVHLRCTLVSQPLSILALLVAVPWGATGVAVASAFGMFVEWLVPAVWGMRSARVEASRLLLRTLPPVLLALVSGVLAYSGVLLTAPGGAICQLMVVAAIALVLVGVALGASAPLRTRVRGIIGARIRRFSAPAQR